jgi:phosphatidylinositol-3-phosphatase
MSSNRGSIRLVTCISMVSMVVLALAVLVAPRTSSARADSGQGNRSDLKNYQHVFVIMMENTGFDSLIGNSNAPWINMAAQTYGLATNYFGVTHPSQPNYIAATSGSTNKVVDDSRVTIDVPNIVDQLEAHEKTWKAYMQSLFAGGNTDKLADSAGNQLYERKHNPFVSYLDVQSNAARMANIVDLSQLDADLANGKVPDYVWISPDQCNDMHGRGGPASDPCSFAHNTPIHNADLIATGDAFLHSTVSEIMASKAWTGNSVIFITWDESDFTGTGPIGFGDTSGCCDANPGGGHVVTLTISHSDHSARTSNVAYNHYSMLATVEGGWKLGCLVFTCDTANVQPMSDLVGPQG